MSGTSSPPSPLARRALAVGVAALIAAVFCAFVDPRAFASAWLMAWLYCLWIALGAAVNVMLHELTGGVWGFAIRRPLEAALGTFPVILLLSVPLAFLLGVLYPWAQAASLWTGGLPTRSAYLQTDFFLLRALVYLGAWLVIASVLRRAWLRGETNAGTKPCARMRTLAAVGLLVYAVTATLAAVDWVMSLSPRWYSTAFGLLTMVSQAFAAFVVATLCAAFMRDIERATTDARATAGDLGNIVLTFALLWAYLAYCQFLIIWSEDLPHEISWYVQRSSPAWQAVAIIVVALQFGLPLVAMLFRSFKRDVRRLAALCAVIVVAQLGEMAWTIAPSTGAEGPRALLIGGVVWVAVFALWGAMFLRELPVTPTMQAPLPSPPEVVEHA